MNGEGRVEEDGNSRGEWRHHLKEYQFMGEKYCMFEDVSVEALTMVTQ